MLLTCCYSGCQGIQKKPTKLFSEFVPVTLKKKKSLAKSIILMWPGIIPVCKHPLPFLWPSCVLLSLLNSSTLGSVPQRLSLPLPCSLRSWVQQTYWRHIGTLSIHTYVTPLLCCLCSVLLRRLPWTLSCISVSNQNVSQTKMHVEGPQGLSQAWMTPTSLPLWGGGVMSQTLWEAPHSLSAMNNERLKKSFSFCWLSSLILCVFCCYGTWLLSSAIWAYIWLQDNFRLSNH